MLLTAFLDNRAWSNISESMKIQIILICFASEQSLITMKQKFETEISEWKQKLSDAQSVIAQLRIDINNLDQDKQQLNLKYDQLEEDNEIILKGIRRLVPFRQERIEGSSFIYYLLLKDVPFLNSFLHS